MTLDSFETLDGCIYLYLKDRGLPPRHRLTEERLFKRDTVFVSSSGCIWKHGEDKPLWQGEPFYEYGALWEADDECS